METITKKQFLKIALEAARNQRLITIGDDGCVKEWVGGGGISDSLDYLRASARANHLIDSQDINFGAFQCCRSWMLETDEQRALRKAAKKEQE